MILEKQIGHLVVDESNLALKSLIHFVLIALIHFEYQLNHFQLLHSVPVLSLDLMIPDLFLLEFVESLYQF